MTKQEITIAIENLEAEVSKLHDAEAVAEQFYDEQVAELLTPYLNQFSILENGFELRVARNYFNIVRCRENESYAREMITLSVRDRYSIKDETYVLDKLDTSFYTTSENSIFELERMVVIGKVAQMLLTHSEEILAKLSELFKTKWVAVRVYTSKRWDIEKELKELRGQLASYTTAEAYEVLKGGVTFIVGKRPLPRLTFRFNSDESLTYLKVVEIKGVSATIEYIPNWSNVVRRDKIRVKNLDIFVTYYRDLILAPLEN